MRSLEPFTAGSPADRATGLGAFAGGSDPPHRAWSFHRTPDRDGAAALLDKLAAAPCRFGPAALDRPLALYGAGNLGRLARDFARAVDQSVALVIDRNAARMEHDPASAGVPLLRPDAVTARDKTVLRVAVSVATARYVPIERALAALGFAHVVPFYDWAENFRHLHPLSNGWFAAPLTAADHRNTAAVLERWDDDVSRAHHLQFLAWRRLREEWRFETAPLPDCARFFIPEVAAALHDHETVLDGGAHHGSVTQTFLAQTGGAFKQIIAVEPDAANLAALKQRLPADPRIAVLDCALGETEGEAAFHAGLDYASQLSDTGASRVMVRPLDGLDVAPSFIKLHLEGAELAALKGARRTLQAHRPIVAATVYHNDDGIWRTASWLAETLPDYRLLFRAHAWCGTGAVLYAIPAERIG
jgi:FkbM family methyltransferase